MKSLKHYLAIAWRDSRPAVYAFVFAFATGAYSFIHAHGFPKTHTDWTVLLWSLGGIAFAALARAVDPFLAKIVAAGAKVAFKGGVVLNQDEINSIVKDALYDQTKAQSIIAAHAVIPATALAPATAEPIPVE